MISVKLLQTFAPKCDAAKLAPILAKYADLHGISTDNREDYFLAMTYVESWGFTRFEEDLNYRASQLVAVWPGRFPTSAVAQPYAHHPEMLAEKVYGGRMGNVHPGDGWKYRGRGLLDTTGLNEYVEASQLTGLKLVENPDLLLDPENAALDAATAWEHRNCNAFADRDDLPGCTRIINGGLVGLADRQAALKSLRQIKAAL